MESEKYWVEFRPRESKAIWKKEHECCRAQGGKNREAGWRQLEGCMPLSGEPEQCYNS